MSLNVERSIPLSSLLPYALADKNKQRVLKDYYFLLKAAEETLDALENGHLDQFDPLVGENMCQIRALKTAMIAGEVLQSLPDLRNGLLRVREKLRLNPKIEDLEVLLTEDELFLIQSFLLTRVKVSQSSKSLLLREEKTDLKRLQQMGATSAFANDLVKKIRRDLSADLECSL